MRIFWGLRSEFAIEVELAEEWWQYQTAIWIKGHRLGDWEDVVMLYPFLSELNFLADRHHLLSVPQIQKLSCLDSYYFLVPMLGQDGKFGEIEESDIEALVDVDRLRLDWGANFDPFSVRVAWTGEHFRFFWRQNSVDPYVKKPETIICASIELRRFLLIYNVFRKILPVTKELLDTLETADAESLANYWTIFSSRLSIESARVQRQVALRICEMVVSVYDPLTPEALEIVRGLSHNEVHPSRQRRWFQKMEDRRFELEIGTYDVFAWALKPGTKSCPSWYAVGVAGILAVEIGRRGWKILSVSWKAYCSNGLRKLKNVF